MIRSTFLAVTLVLLVACAQQADEQAGEQNDGASTGEGQTDTPTAVSEQPKHAAQRLEVTVANPWAASLRRQDNQTWLAAISHIEDSLHVWSIGSDRESRSAATAQVGFHPDSVRWADWDGDGRAMELLVTVEGRSQIQLWRFEAGQLLELGTTKVADPPQTVTVSDLDGDSQPDLIVGPYDKERLTVLWNSTNFEFEPAYLATRQTPSYPVVTDWNKDQRPDILWSDWQAGSVQVALGQEGRKFQRLEIRKPGPGAPRQVIAGDIDGDSWPDAVAVLEVGKSALILYNDGTGGVAREERIPAPLVGYSSAAVTQDAEGPGPMLALSETEVIVFARREGESWALRQMPGSGGLMVDFQFVDADADGVIDLLYANSSGESVSIIFGPLWESAEPLEL